MEARVDTAALLELNSVAAIVECLLAGIGVALLPERAAARELAAGRLVRLHWSEPLAEDLYFVRHRDKPLVGAYGAFVAQVEEYFEEQRARQASEPRGAPLRCRSRRGGRTG